VGLAGDGNGLSHIVRHRIYAGYLYDIQRGTFDRITFDHDALAGAISPDGNSFIYTINRDNAYGVWLKSLRDGSERRLIANAHAYEFAWSKDHHHIAFMMLDDAHSLNHIRIVTLGSETQERWMTDDRVTEAFPAFSPDGKWIAYAAGDVSVQHIYMRS